MPTSDKKFVAAIKKLPCVACGRSGPSEAHHIKGRRSFGDDAHNLIPLCPEHHRGHLGWHGGQWTFMRAYPHVVELLEALGWEVDVSRETLFHAEYAKPNKCV